MFKTVKDDFWNINWNNQILKFFRLSYLKITFYKPLNCISLIHRCDTCTVDVTAISAGQDRQDTQDSHTSFGFEYLSRQTMQNFSSSLLSSSFSIVYFFLFLFTFFSFSVETCFTWEEVFSSAPLVNTSLLPHSHPHFLLCTSFFSSLPLSPFLQRPFFGIWMPSPALPQGNSWVVCLWELVLFLLVLAVFREPAFRNGLRGEKSSKIKEDIHLRRCRMIQK